MISKCKRLMLAVLLLLLSATVCLSQVSDQREITQKVVSLKMIDTTVPIILQTLSSEYKVPVGLEIISYTKSKGEGKKINVDFRKGTLSELLDQVVREDPRYKWEVVSGVINVFPREGADSLLGTKVKRFQVSQQNRDETKRAIFNLPEVSSALSQRGIQPSQIAFSVSSGKDKVRLSLDLQGTSVRDILNEIAKTTSFWVTTRFGENDEFFVINF